MSFADHKIQKFTQTITQLPDQPNLSAGDLKACFDSSPEELRQAVNSICDEGDRLDKRVEGIITETFGNTITKSMLSDELAAELDAKATQTALAAEIAARENDSEALQSALLQRCQVFFGTYQGDENSSQFINLGFTPQMVIIGTYDLIGIATPEQPLMVNERNAIKIEENGFRVYYNLAYKVYFNDNAMQHYIAIL